jgi:hypothetical protein
MGIISKGIEKIDEIRTDPTNMAIGSLCMVWIVFFALALLPNLVLPPNYLVAGQIAILSIILPILFIEYLYLTRDTKSNLQKTIHEKFMGIITLFSLWFPINIAIYVIVYISIKISKKAIDAIMQFFSLYSFLALLVIGVVIAFIIYCWINTKVLSYIVDKRNKKKRIKKK